jgi:hypothetical protein
MHCIANICVNVVHACLPGESSYAAFNLEALQMVLYTLATVQCA